MHDFRFIFKLLMETGNSPVVLLIKRDNHIRAKAKPLQNERKTACLIYKLRATRRRRVADIQQRARGGQAGGLDREGRAPSACGAPGTPLCSPLCTLPTTCACRKTASPSPPPPPCAGACGSLPSPRSPGRGPPAPLPTPTTPSVRNVDLLVEVGPQERLGHVGLAEVGVTRVADAEQGAECRLVHHRGVGVVRVVVVSVALPEALWTCD